MSAPLLTAEDLDPDDLVADNNEGRSTSETRRMGSNAQAALEIELRKSQPDAEPLKAGETPKTPPRPSGKPTGQPVVLVAAAVASAAKPIVDPASGDRSDLRDRSDGPGVSLPKPYLAGDVIAGKYRLTRIIGRGGMGAVWQAHNIPLDIDVAIKLIRRDRTAAGAADRLLTEARAAARLMHPAIVRVFDFGESEQGDPFIVMELLHGESLSAILRRKKRISAPVAVQTLLPVASALVSAHNKGIVHRDLKPDNIIIVSGENGALQPKIVDFGIAKLLDMDRQVTLAGEVLGSPDYMSPEQARGAENVGEATDIWAFSVVLYELISGARPFDGANYNALIASILTNDPAPITAHGVGDGALASILSQGLTKDVSERWPRMRDLGAALASWAVERDIEDDVAGNSITKQWLAGAAKRLLTVQPDDYSLPVPSGPLPAAGAPAPAIPRAPVRPAMETMVARPRRGPRLVWIAPAVAIVGVLGTAAFFGRERLAQLLEEQLAGPATSADAVPSASSSAPPAPTSAEPPASASAEPPPASASAPVSASGAPIGSGRPGVGKPYRKNKAPQAPKNIKF